MRTLPAALLLIGLSPFQRLVAQTSSVSGITRPVSRELAEELFKDMANGLRRLVTAQEEFFTTHNTYGHVLSREDRKAVFILPPPGVTLTLTYATRNAWTARAWHEWMPGVSCVISVGPVPPSRVLRTTANRQAPQEEGVPVCDSPR